MPNRHSVHVVSGMHEKLKKMGPKFYGPEEHLAIGVVRKQVLSTLFTLVNEGTQVFWATRRPKHTSLDIMGNQTPVSHVTGGDTSYYILSGFVRCL
jgi:hypothetical protein